MVVKIAFRPMGWILAGKYGADQFLGSRLAVAAGDSDDRDIELLAVVSGQSLQGGQDVIHFQQPFVIRAIFFINYAVGSAIFKCLPCKLIAIEPFPFQRKKEATGSNLSAVGHYFGMLPEY